MRRIRILWLGATAAMLIATFWLVGPAAAAQGALAAAGRQEVAAGGACAGATFVMTGDLDGCWTTETFDVVAAGPNGIVVARGTEQFVGCIGARCGTLSFSFVFVGRFDAAGVELWGDCHHPITGGSGDFAGATGALNFVDDPDGSGLPPADYKGRIVLPD